MFPLVNFRKLTWVTVAFSLAALLQGVAALFDWTVLNTTDLSLALPLARARLEWILFSALSVLYFAKWTTVGRSHWDAVFAIPAAAILHLNWTVMSTGMEMAPWGPHLLLDPLYYGAYAALVLGYNVVALVLLAKGARTALRADRALGLPICVFLAAIVLVVGIGFATNIQTNLRATGGFPYFSSLLFIPALLLLGFMLRVSPEKMLRVWREVALGEGRTVLAACLLDLEGDILGVATPSVDQLVPSRGLPDILATIDGFISTAFRTSLHTLRTIIIGDITYMVSRGSKFILVLVIQGHFHDYFQILVRQGLERLEKPDIIVPLDPQEIRSSVIPFLQEMVNPRVPDILQV